MSIPALIGLSTFAVTTFVVGFMIMSIGAIGPGGRPASEVPLKDWLKHSYGFALGAVPGAISGLLAFLVAWALASFIF